jgi:hypothetical protein
MNEEREHQLQLTKLSLRSGLVFSLDAPDPTGTGAGYVKAIRQTPDGYMVEVWNELKNHDEATHKAHLYIIHPHNVEWLRADGLLVNNAVSDEEE